MKTPAAKAAMSGTAAAWKTLRVHLDRELTLTRDRGWAIEEEETVAGVACVAISSAGWAEPLAALSVSVPVTGFPRHGRRR